MEEAEAKPTFCYVKTSQPAFLREILLWDLSGVKTEDIPVVAFLTEVTREVGTKTSQTKPPAQKSTSTQVASAQNATVITESVVDNIYYPKFWVSGKDSSEYQPQLLSLIEEIVHRSNLDDVEKIKELLLNVKADLEMNFNMGHTWRPFVV